MPKKRRKLDPNMEKQILAAKQQVELITAKINDIQEEDIQIEYRQSFDNVLIEIRSLEELYKTSGISDEATNIYSKYSKLLDTFLSEYEL